MSKKQPSKIYLEVKAEKNEDGDVEYNMIDGVGNHFLVGGNFSEDNFAALKEAAKGNHRIKMIWEEGDWNNFRVYVDKSRKGPLCDDFEKTRICIYMMEGEDALPPLENEDEKLAIDELPEIAKKVIDSTKTIPKDLVVDPIKWKFMTQSILRGNNIMMTGPSGCGKTKFARRVAEALERKLFKFNMGASQDPRGYLVGNVQFDPGRGTFLGESEFVKAIQTPGAIILLDELSRAHPDAWNILMSVLDQTQRYLRLDEAIDTPTINVAEGVSFIATANIGAEYTSTRVMDRAIMDRFRIIEMVPMSKVQELKYLKTQYPKINDDLLDKIAGIAAATRDDVYKEDAKLSTIVSTRKTEEICELIIDGFSLNEACEVCVFPWYPEDGGPDSERTYIKQLVQKWIPSGGGTLYK